MTALNIVNKIQENEWQAQLDLGFTVSNGRTVLSRRNHYGPLQVQKPFYPEENGTSHVYVLHPPGGVVGGDFLKLNINLAEEARVLITTPAAGKFYRSSGSIARQSQNVRVAPGGVLEWFPMENIIFSGAKVHIKTRIDLTKDSQFTGWDIFCLGRPACGESLDEGFLKQQMEVFRDGIPIRIENLNAEGDSDFLKSKWGLMGYPVIGNMICATDKKEIVDLIRNIGGDSSKNEIFSVSHTEGIVFCRFLGDSAERAKAIFVKAWRVFRSAIMGLDIVEPRIWKT